MEKASRFLTKQQADQRFAQIQQKSITYKVYLKLMKGPEYNAQIDLEFTAVHVDTDLFIDFENKAIKSLIINKHEIKDVKWDGLFITLPKEFLIKGVNNIQIQVDCLYRNDGTGLHSFTDTDGKQYLYSQGEAYFNNRVFPFFDQPDLKSYMEVELFAPKDWIVLSNEKPVKIQAFSEGDYEFYSFPRTKLLPSYLFAFIAGPYQEIVHKNPYKGIPMSLFCRSSLLQYLEKLADFIFETTDGAMKVYEDYFGYPYPFNKYDQVFCAEYNMGAMENAGLVTFNDLYIWKEEVDTGKYTWLADVITHELSHHWFGNLVTMKWWNDLWLNESFADFISHFCISKYQIKAKPIQDIWLAFNVRKSWGYRTDQMITTHPIAGDVPNTEAAQSIFDGITYSKGASTLRQLMALIGEEAFGAGVKKYFNKYQFQNATLDNLLECMNEEFQKNNKDFSLQTWKEEWICKAGLNECQPSFNPDDKSPQAKLVIKQTAALPQHPTLRRHKMKVAFFDSDANITDQSILLLPQDTTEITYDGSKGYKAVLLNYCDWAFIKVLLDDKSIEFFKQNLHKVKDTLTRTLVWRAFFDMLRDGKISSEEYVDMFVNQLPLEESDDIVTNQYLFVPTATTFTPLKYQNVLNDRLFDFSVKFMLSIPKEKKNRFLAVKSKLPGFARSDEKIDFLLQWYKGTNDHILKQFELGNQVEWDVVSKVCGSNKYTKAEKESLFAEQKKKDQSDTATNMEYKCKALYSTPQEKEELWNMYLNPETKLSMRIQQYSMTGFNNINCLDEIKPYYEKWFENLIKVFKERAIDFSDSFFSCMFPQYFDLDYIHNGLKKINENCDEQLVMLKKKVNEGIDDLLRVKRAYECFYARSKLAKQ